MDDLQAAADAIKAQLDLASSLSTTISATAASGQIVSDGTVDPAMITSATVDQYNTAYQNVLNASYLTASDVLHNEAQIALDNMSSAIDDLVAATAVLTTVATVADMAANANTTTEQLQVQQALSTTDMSVDQGDVDNFNNALSAVESYAQSAGAFLSASQDSNITGAIDSYAAANNVAVASYTAVSYTQSVDKFIIEFGNAAYLEFNGTFTDQTMSAQDIWTNVGYSG